jgi:hypothetical protein
MKFDYLARISGKLLVTGGALVGLLAISVPASADTVFSATFFSVTTSNAANSDFHPGGVATGTDSSNEVMPSLSGGMPVYNPGHNNLSGTVTAPHDLGGGNVIEWWTPGTYNGVNTIVETGNGPLNVSSNIGSPTNMFPPDSQGNTNQNGFEETAILSGDFLLGAPGTVTMGIAADDDAFIFIDGQYLGGLGGIQGIGSSLTSFTSGTLGAGWHNVEIFYADQDEVAASLAFSSNVAITPTPEPGSLALLGTGVLGLAGTLRRRMKQ